MTYLKQMDRTIELTAQLAPKSEPVDAGKLAVLFQRWRAREGSKRE
jgi:hypothetical protein